jgi:hypothetical protein
MMFNPSRRLCLLVITSTCLALYVAWYWWPQSRRYPKLGREYALIALSCYGDFGIGLLEKAHALIDRVADVNVRNRSGVTPLMRACETLGYAETFLGKNDAASLLKYVSVLLEHGANPNLGVGTEKGPALCRLAEAINDLGGENEDLGRYIRNAMELLLDHHAEVNARDGSGNTPLMITAWSSASNVLDMVKYLLVHGADPNLRNNEGRTALSIASDRAGAAQTVRELLANGADPNIRDNRGSTPLFYSRQWVSWIVANECDNGGGRGTDVYLSHDYGADPEECTGWMGEVIQQKLTAYESIVSALLSHGAKETGTSAPAQVPDSRKQ